jgi:histidinol-phosphate aminotransferase
MHDALLRSTDSAAFDIVWLDSNENPYGALPSAAVAMRRALRFGNRYPFRAATQLIERIAHYHQVGASHVTLGAGSTEVLRMAVHAFSGLGKRLILANPTFHAIATYATAAGAELVPVALTPDFGHDLEAMLKAASIGAGLVYVCNPNNPSGGVTPSDDLADFIAHLPSAYAVLVDEAYHHFAIGCPGYATLLGHPRVIVARTFSKVYGMAGMRLGYAVASEELTTVINLHQLDTNINVVAAAGAMASLDDEVGMNAVVRRVEANRNEFVRQAKVRNLAVLPSAANFAMIRTGQSASAINKKFAEQGVHVGRPFPPLNDFVRITFGTPSEMKRFWTVWDNIMAAPQVHGQGESG